MEARPGGRGAAQGEPGASSRGAARQVRAAAAEDTMDELIRSHAPKRERDFDAAPPAKQRATTNDLSLDRTLDELFAEGGALAGQLRPRKEEDARRLAQRGQRDWVLVPGGAPRDGAAIGVEIAVRAGAVVLHAEDAVVAQQKLPKSHLQRAAKNGRTGRVAVLFASSWVT